MDRARALAVDRARALALGISKNGYGLVRWHQQQHQQLQQHQRCTLRRTMQLRTFLQSRAALYGTCW